MQFVLWNQEASEISYNYSTNFNRCHPLQGLPAGGRVRYRWLHHYDSVFNVIVMMGLGAGDHSYSVQRLTFVRSSAILLNIITEGDQHRNEADVLESHNVIKSFVPKLDVKSDQNYSQTNEELSSKVDNYRRSMDTRSARELRAFIATY